MAESRVKKWSVFHTTNFRSRPGEIEAMPARKASPHRFSARRAIESPPLQLHPKTVSQLCRWEHIFWLPQLEWLGAFQLVHGFMHFPCANLITEQTVPLARSNAFHRLQNGAELILRTAGPAYFLQPFVSSSATHPLPSSLNPSPAPQTLGIICSTVPLILPAIVLRSDVTAASSEPPSSPSHQSQVEGEILERQNQLGTPSFVTVADLAHHENNQPLAIIRDGG